MSGWTWKKWNVRRKFCFGWRRNRKGDSVMPETPVRRLSILEVPTVGCVQQSADAPPLVKMALIMPRMVRLRSA